MITQYYGDKYGWQQDTFNDSDWELQHKALSSYSENDQHRIIKFVYGWLPTNKQLFCEGIKASPKYQLCDHLEETSKHLLACPHTSMENICTKLLEFQWKDVTNHGNSKLNNILKLAVTECPFNQEWTPSLANTSPELQDCIRRQTQIGWAQIFQGRITKAMATFMDNHFCNINVNTRIHGATTLVNEKRDHTQIE
jgi:hypothetical protein